MNMHAGSFTAPTDLDTHEPALGYAVVGMSGRFPGAPDVASLWAHLKGAKTLTTHFEPEELEDCFTPTQRSSKDYVASKPVLDDVDLFDAGFFNMYAKEAALTDPQSRVFLEICWEALEDAGLDPSRYPGAVGVWAGCSAPTYFWHHVLRDRATIEECTSNYQVGCFPMLVGASVDGFATRVAYKLDLRGPAVTVLTACSTSLTAIAQACQALSLGHTDVALAGGVSITFPQRRGYFAQDGGMVSADGTCRPFDAAANGTVFGHGAGVVVLKRLDDALANRDQIYAVVRGCGINNDGSDKVAFTAPSVGGQAEAIRLAHADAGIDPTQVGYVECHGTATPLGDPIEFHGLVDAFEGAGRGSCALGSAKANIGHLDAAAGVTGFIKAALMVRDGVIPPLTHFQSPNPAIDLDHSPFYVPTALTDWPETGSPRTAGVSSFGVGGTNVHVVLQEPPTGAGAAAEEAISLLTLSARTEAELSRMRHAVAKKLSANGDLSLADAAFTLQCGRKAFSHRFAAAVASRQDAIDALCDEKRKSREAESHVPVTFLFPGQGAQYPGMGSGLYRNEPEFAQWIDQGVAMLEPLIDCDMARLLCYGEVSDADAARALSETRLTQPALFITSFALAKLWESRGVRPDVLVGHSVGEFAAAAFAGILTFEEALRLIVRRGELMQSLERGAMLSVRAAAEEVEAALVDGVDVAAVNAPNLCTVAGPDNAIAQMEQIFRGRNVAAKRLHTSHAFHSHMMDEVVGPMTEAASSVDIQLPSIPMVSAVTGRSVTAREPWSAASIGEHCRACVRFADAIAFAAGDKRPAMIEMGPGRTLLAFAGQTVGRSGTRALTQSLPDHNRDADDQVTFEAGIGDIWCAGAPVAFDEWPRGDVHRVSLPHYPFSRQRHWVDAPAPTYQVQSKIVGRRAMLAEEAPAPTRVERRREAQMSSSTPPESEVEAALSVALMETLSDLSGEPLGIEEAHSTFLELGFDSLFLGQFSQRIGRDYGVEITFRQLLSTVPSVAALASDIAPTLSAEVVATLVGAPASASHTDAEGTQAAEQAPSIIDRGRIEVPATTMPSTTQASAGEGADVQSLMVAQVQAMQALFAQQLQSLESKAGRVVPTPAPAPTSATAPTLASTPAKRAVPVSAQDVPDTPTDAPTLAQSSSSRFALAGISQKGALDRTAVQDQYIADLIARYETRNAGSKAYAAKHRKHLADPRSAAGFRADWKELVFPLVGAKAKGSRIWDVDGNEYLDLVNGYGQTAFGHAPDFVLEAIAAQAADGFAIGPQAVLAGEVAEMIAQMTGHERVTFCNTGSEAVMAAMRVARAVTGRERVVVFSNDYHGQFDEVLVKGRARGTDRTALPIAPGIPRSSVSNITVLGYGDSESLEWIRAHRDDLAAVIVEPVQSRHPDLRPEGFVRELRAMADEAHWALVFDEVVTGFRVHPAGMQGLWGIKGDLATYGKVVGGGMPVGLLAGDARFMDALDGGHWSYGDQSVPEVAPTFFAGTFVRHPLVLAAMKATIEHIKGDGAELYGRVAERTKSLATAINGDLAARGCPVTAEMFSSWFTAAFSGAHPLASLIYPVLRLQGIHVQEGFACFLTTAHLEDDFQRVEAAFRAAIDELQSVGILTADGEPARSARPASPTTPMTQPEASLPDEVPLTAAQTEVWLAAQLGDEASCAFNESLSLELNGRLDRTALIASLNGVVARHDALRLVFSRDGTHFSVADPSPLEVDWIDLSGKDDPDPAFRDVLAHDAEKPFDLGTGTPLRAALVRLAAERHILVVTAHHIVCDGWSLNIIVDELAALYNEAVSGTPARLASVPGFTRYAVHEARTPDKGLKEEAFWKDVYKTVPALPELPLDRPRPPVRSYAGATTTYHLGSDLHRAVKKAGAKQGATLFTTLFGTLQVLLARLSGERDIVIGCPTAGQSLLDDPALVGHCVNFLPIRSPIAQGTTLGAHLAATQAKVLEAFEHQDFTYGTLVRALQLERSVGRLPLTEYQFNLERIGGGASFDGLEAKVSPNPKSRSNFDAFFNVIEGDDGLRIDVDYNSEVLDETTVRRWLGHWQTLLSDLVNDPEQAVDTAPLHTVSQIHELVEGFNATAMAFDRSATVLDLIRAQVEANPDRMAAVHQAEVITYRELGERVDELAHRLCTELPDGSGRVAVAVERSIDMLVALLAVWAAGRTYVPLDPRHPPARLAMILEDAAPLGLIAATDGVAALADGSDMALVRLDVERKGPKPAVAPVLPTAEDAAYVIFTSGSTGKPKGVAVPHRAVVNFLHSMAREPGLSPDDTLLAVTTVSFDIAVLELFLPLTVGANVVIADTEDVLDGFRLVKMLDTAAITVCQATPTLWSMLLEAGFAPSKELKILAGGEPLPSDLAAKLASGAQSLWNMYGPTETTIWSSLAKINAPADQITIGKPIANTEMHILDPNEQLAPIGAAGELWIGGDGLALGYHRRPDLNDAAFRMIALPGRAAPMRLYRTGDAGRRLPDGTIQLLGRRDNQVKLRGFRIELGDVETAMRAVPGVTKAVADVRENSAGNRQLVGYVVAADGADPTPEIISMQLAHQLPNYMVPSVFVVLDALPQTTNGKLDRKALPMPAAVATGAGRKIVLPRNSLEQSLLEIWSEVLGVSSIGTTDNIFALGADSLDIFRIAARMTDRELGLEARHIFLHPTIGELAAVAPAAKGQASALPSLRSFRGGARRSVAVLA
ncbi:MAG: amino acid adenylation domain-containing protein [Pseudomonadota bacterium]